MSQVSGFYAMYFKEFPQAPGQISNLTKIRTRRRPGREAQVNQHLIPLLRNPTTIDIPAPISKVDVPFLRDDLAPMQGGIICLVLIVPLLGGVAGLFWEMLR